MLPWSGKVVTDCFTQMVTTLAVASWLVYVPVDENGSATLSRLVYDGAAAVEVGQNVFHRVIVDLQVVVHEVLMTPDAQPHNNDVRLS
jgi:ureidoglycolate hydrolase